MTWKGSIDGIDWLVIWVIGASYDVICDLYIQYVPSVCLKMYDYTMWCIHDYIYVVSYIINIHPHTTYWAYQYISVYPVSHLPCLTPSTSNYWLIDWLIDRLIDWLIDRLVDWLIDWRHRSDTRFSKAAVFRLHAAHFSWPNGKEENFYTFSLFHI